MLILCSEGCLLKSAISPSIKCLFTISPYSNIILFTSTCLREIVYELIYSFSFFFVKLFAPGYLNGPFLISLYILSILYFVTISGNVRFIAIVIGTPYSSILIFGSTEITVLAEKSTRFP